MHHDSLYGTGSLRHAQLDSALDPAGGATTTTLGYGVDDMLCLESSMENPASGTPAARATWQTFFSLYSFPNAADRFLQTVVQLPHSYVAGTPLLWHVHFMPTTQIAAGETVQFMLGVAVLNANATYSTTTNYTTTYTAPANVAADTHLKTTSVSIPGTGAVGSAIVIGRMNRVIADTFAGDVLLLSADFHIRKSRLGSATESPLT